MSKTLNYRYFLLLAGLLGFGFIVEIHLLGLRSLYEIILTKWGFHTSFALPFIDNADFFAALKCHAQGVDVFQNDPCDPLNRPHVYPVLVNLWQFLNFGLGAVPYAGIAMGAGFICSVAWIANPKNAGEAGIYLLALFSSSVAFALERANMDVLIFSMVVCACTGYGNKASGRLRAYILIFIAAMLKFYPIVALSLILKEKRRRAIGLCVVFGAAWLFFLFAARHDLGEMWNSIPDFDPFLDPYGARNITRIISSLYTVLESGAQAPLWLPHFLLIVFGSISVLSSVFISQWLRRHGSAFLSEGPAANLFFAGGAIVVFTFFTTVNIPYRQIFLLLLLPHLIGLRRNSAFRKLMASAILTIIILLWFPCLLNNMPLLEGFQAGAFFVVMVREPLWWGLVTIVMALIQADLWLRQSRSKQDNL